MKKTVLAMGIALLAGGILSSCGNKNAAQDSDTIVAEEAVGEVVEMPAESSAASDTVVAAAEAVAVADTVVPAK